MGKGYQVAKDLMEHFYYPVNEEKVMNTNYIIHSHKLLVLYTSFIKNQKLQDVANVVQSRYIQQLLQTHFIKILHGF